MANVSTVTAVWNGFTGAPGYSLFRFEELSTAALCNAAGAAVKAFFVGVGTAFYGPLWTIGIQPIVQHHDIATGDLQGESTMTTPPTPIAGVGSGSATWAGGSGAVAQWTTGLVHAGRKVRGRTYLVPILQTAFSNDGTVSTAFASGVQTAGNALIADATTAFGVYSRFWDKKPGDPPLGVAPVQVGGAFAAATGCVVPDRSAQLRSRRS